VKTEGTTESFMPGPVDPAQEYEFWGVLFEYVSGFKEIVVDELGCIGSGDTREEDVKFKLWDEINRLHIMGEKVTVYTDEEANHFATELCKELRGDDEVKTWSLVSITVDMKTQPPGLPQEKLDAIEAFARESWAEYLAETAKTQPKCSCM